MPITGIFTLNRKNILNDKAESPFNKITNKTFQNCQIEYGNFRWVQFEECIFNETIFYACDLTCTQFKNCKFQLCHFFNILPESMSLENCVTQETYFTYCGATKRSLKDIEGIIERVKQIYVHDKKYLPVS